MIHYIVLKENYHTKVQTLAFMTFDTSVVEKALGDLSPLESDEHYTVLKLNSSTTIPTHGGGIVPLDRVDVTPDSTKLPKWEAELLASSERIVITNLTPNEKREMEKQGRARRQDLDTKFLHY